MTTLVATPARNYPLVCVNYYDGQSMSDKSKELDHYTRPTLSDAHSRHGRW